MPLSLSARLSMCVSFCACIMLHAPLLDTWPILNACLNRFVALSSVYNIQVSASLSVYLSLYPSALFPVLRIVCLSVILSIAFERSQKTDGQFFRCIVWPILQIPLHLTIHFRPPMSNPIAPSPPAYVSLGLLSSLSGHLWPLACLATCQSQRPHEALL